MSPDTHSGPDREVRFVRTVVGWADRRRGDLAALRRSLARRPGTDPATLRIVLPLLGGIDERDQWRFFLVAGLVALEPDAHRNDDRSGADFGTAARTLAAHARAGAVEQRFVRLLDADAHELPHHLRQMVRLLASGGTRWDAARLLADLRNWEHPDRYVQRSWARSFWTPAPQSDPPSPADPVIAAPTQEAPAP